MQFLSTRSSRLLSATTSATTAVASTSAMLFTSQQQLSSSSSSSPCFSKRQNTAVLNNRTMMMNLSSFSSSSSSSRCSAAAAIHPTSCCAIRTAVQEVRPGDWLCANCGENNFRYRAHCNLCKKPRAPNTAGGAGGSDADGGDVAPSMNEELTRGTSKHHRDILPGRNSSGNNNNNNKGLGDWTCPVCQSLNFKFRSECFSCREARPASERPPKGLELTEENMKPGDWKCPECNGINFRGRTTCFTCRSPRSHTASAAASASFGEMSSRAGGRIGGSGSGGRGTGGSGSGGRGTIAMKRGDWLCQSCSEHNFADRPSCFRCGQPRGDAKGYQPSRSSPSGADSQQDGSTASPSATKGSSKNKSARGAGISEQVMEGDWMCVECGVNNFRRRSVCVKCKTAKPGGGGAAEEEKVQRQQNAGEKEASKLADPLSDDL